MEKSPDAAAASTSEVAKSPEEATETVDFATQAAHLAATIKGADGVARTGMVNELEKSFQDADLEVVDTKPLHPISDRLVEKGLTRRALLRRRALRNEREALIRRLRG